jgi:dipeptidyl-peptidase-4
VRWSPRAPLTLTVLNRAQTDLALLAVEADGSTRELLREHDDAWLNVDQDFPQWLADGQRYLWATERNGAWQIERRALTEEAPVALTPPDLDLRGLVRYDEAHDALYAHVGDATGAAQLARITRARGAPRVEALTHAAAEHTVTVARDGSLQVREIHSLEALPVFTLHDADGAPLGALASTVEVQPAGSALPPAACASSSAGRDPVVVPLLWRQ